MSTMTPTARVLHDAANLLERGACKNYFGKTKRRKLHKLKDALQRRDRLVKMCAVTAVYMVAEELVGKRQSKKLATNAFVQLLTHLNRANERKEAAIRVMNWFGGHKKRESIAFMRMAAARVACAG